MNIDICPSHFKYFLELGCIIFVRSISVSYLQSWGLDAFILLILLLHLHLQLCAGLKHMHNLDPPYAHNDVKPGNVLITHRKGQPPLAIVMDFGSTRPSRKQICSRSEALQLQVIYDCASFWHV